MRLRGFTLVEILVAMVILAVGLLGMAALTVLVTKVGRGASDLTAATNVCQLKLEELKDVQWDLLGCNAACGETNALTYGVVNAQVCQETDLNSQGKTKSEVQAQVPSGPDQEPTVTALGPYRYTRSFVICRGDQYTDSSATGPPENSENFVSSASNEPPQAADCRVDGTDSTRVEALACKPEDITGTAGTGNREKKVKALCTWTDRSGQCHSVHMDTTVVKLQ